jgi:hypothetical protein
VDLLLGQGDGQHQVYASQWVSLADLFTRFIS